MNSDCNCKCNSSHPDIFLRIIKMFYLIFFISYAHICSQAPYHHICLCFSILYGLTTIYNICFFNIIIILFNIGQNIWLGGMLRKRTGCIYLETIYRFILNNNLHSFKVIHSYDASFSEFTNILPNFMYTMTQKMRITNVKLTKRKTDNKNEPLLNVLDKFFVPFCILHH